MFSRTKGVIAFLLFLASVGLFWGSFSITGAFIGPASSQGLNVLALVVFTSSLILLIYNRQDKKDRLAEIIRMYEKGEIDPLEAAYQINTVVPIREVRFKPGKEHTVYGNDDAYPIPIKNGGPAEELAFAEYFLAQHNNPGTHSQFHLGKGASTKHHKAGFLALLEKERARLRRKYGRDFETKHRSSLDDVL